MCQTTNKDEGSMKRTTIMIPEDLKIKALKHARMLGISLGQLVRESLKRRLQTSKDVQPVDDPLFADDVVFQGETPSDLAENHDSHLYKG
jgi:hypothetical protein